MSCKVIGYQQKDYSFTDERTGGLVSGTGTTLYLVQNRKGVEGVACFSAFVSKQKLDLYDPCVGDEVEILYNRFGKVAGVRLIQKAGK